VRAYQAAGDTTLEDRQVQARGAGWDIVTTEDEARLWASMSPAQRAFVAQELVYLEGVGPRPSGRMPRR
jgi:hypothetical protein